MSVELIVLLLDGFMYGLVELLRWPEENILDFKVWKYTVAVLGLASVDTYNLSQAAHCKNRDLFSSFERSVRPNARFYSEFLSGCLCDKSHGYLF